jgi:hypothetical protein
MFRAFSIHDRPLMHDEVGTLCLSAGEQHIKQPAEKPGFSPHSGSGLPLVSGANQMMIIPTTYMPANAE